MTDDYIRTYGPYANKLQLDQMGIRLEVTLPLIITHAGTWQLARGAVVAKPTDAGSPTTPFERFFQRMLRF